MALRRKCGGNAKRDQIMNGRQPRRTARDVVPAALSVPGSNYPASLLNSQLPLPQVSHKNITATGHLIVVGANQQRHGIDNSLHGMRLALEGERVQAIHARRQYKQVKKTGDFYTITLTNGASEVLLEVQEGWSVGVESSISERKHPWRGQIVDIDLHEPVRIVVESKSEENIQQSETLIFYRPDYLTALKSWVQECIAENKDLPPLYKQLQKGTYAQNNFNIDIDDNAVTALSLRLSQKNAIELLNNKLGIIWGPPGTGKTFTLGAAVALANNSNKILVLAPTNTAADQAAISIDNARKLLGRELQYGELIRPGRPKLKEIENRHHLLAWSKTQAAISQKIVSIMEQRQKLDAKRQAASGAKRLDLTSEVGILKAEENKLKKDRSTELWRLAHNADIIVTTIHSFLFNEPVLEEIREANIMLVLDEASMVSRSFLARLMEFKINQLLLFGDFKQLNPIRTCEDEWDNNSKFWISDSAFDACGLSDDSDIGDLENANILAMLTEQNRMHPDICRNVSKQFYLDKLRTCNFPSSLEPPLVSCLPNKAVIIAAKAPPEKIENGQRDSIKLKNICHASARRCISLAKEILEERPETSLLFITPFRNQARLLQELATVGLPPEANWKAGTVHVSQGQEADIVFFCPVDPEHAWLTGELGKADLEQLLCVAFSRPRSHMIVVGEGIAGNVQLRALCSGAARI